MNRDPLPYAVVCVNDVTTTDTATNKSFKGRLIGRSDSYVYLGDTTNKRIEVIPMTRVGEIEVGTSTPACQVPPAKSS